MIFENIKYVLFIFLFIGFGCENLMQSPTEFEKFSVGAFITNDSTNQKIFVFRTTPLDHKDSLDYFYSKADIYISSKTDLFPFRYFEDEFGGKYYTNTLSVDFKPGEKYNLTVNTESGSIKGETVFPENFKIISPLDNQEFIFTNKKIEISLKWTSSIRAYTYLINIKIPIRSPTGGYFINYSFLTNETNFEYSNDAFVTLYDSTKKSEIIITAVDKNFYQHHLEQYNSAGLTGGYGYFGSGVVKKISLRFIIQ